MLRAQESSSERFISEDRYKLISDVTKTGIGTSAKVLFLVLSYTVSTLLSGRETGDKLKMAGRTARRMTPHEGLHKVISYTGHIVEPESRRRRCTVFPAKPAQITDTGVLAYLPHRDLWTRSVSQQGDPCCSSPTAGARGICPQGVLLFHRYNINDTHGKK